MVAVLENIRSVYNVGSIFRTADGAGIEKLYLTGITPTPLNKLGKPRKKMKKTALGATESVDWEKVESTNDCLKKLKEKEYRIITLEEGEENSKAYYKTSLPNREQTALLVGNEVDGVSEKSLNQSDQIISIPMKGKKKSLNVAVAFGIISYYIQHQK